MTDHSSDEWTQAERERLAEVGRQRSPRSELKGRTIRALRDQGLLGSVELPRRRRWFAVGLAAAIVVFAAGMLAGYSVGLRRQAGASDTITNRGAGAGPAREVARLDSPATQGASTPMGRHVVWF